MKLFKKITHFISPTRMLDKATLSQLPKLQKYAQPSLATDSLVLRGDSLESAEVLLITRKNDPYKSCFAFPGGFVDYNEEPMAGCMRELEEETHLKALKAELFAVKGDPKRDPRKHVVSIIYRVHVSPDAQPKAGDDAATARFYKVNEIIGTPQKFAFDHFSVLQSLLEKQKLMID